MSVEIIEQGLTYRNDYVRCHCPKCNTLVTMVKRQFGPIPTSNGVEEYIGYYGCPKCCTAYDFTNKNDEPTIIDLINYNREKLNE